LLDRPLLLQRVVAIGQQLFRFGVVGVVATASYYLMMLLFMNLLRAPLPQTHAMATILSLLVSYIGHHSVTFEAEGRHPYYFRRFCISSVALFCLSSTFLWGATTALMISSETAVGMVALGYPVASFALHRIWSFRSPAVEAL
jgi:putative flippase GtrA